MEQATSLQELARDRRFRRVAVACGVFDGVHRGHQAIIDALHNIAEKTSSASVVLTFEPHPRAVLSPGTPPPRLTTPTQKLRLLSRTGVHAAVVLEFTPELAGLHPAGFVTEYLRGPGFEVTAVCVGSTWRFGARGTGDVEFLRRSGRKHGFQVVSVPEFHWYGQPVSSTRIREAVSAGRVRKAARMLGRPYSVHARVVRGRGMGEKALQCPTANLLTTHLLLPPPGVYAARARIYSPPAEQTEQVDLRESATRDAVAYIGSAPTFHPCGTPPRQTLEVHLFNFKRDLYEKELEVDFLEFIRSEKQFEQPGNLAEQVQRDCRAAQRAIERRHK